jgi:SAM-dependent methyltransferase
LRVFAWGSNDMSKKTDEPCFEHGVIVGNYFNKYESSNPIARRLVKGFCSSLISLVELSGARDVHEVGCGEGYLTAMLAGNGRRVRASDLSAVMVGRARAMARDKGLAITFSVKSIYDLGPEDGAELVMCCEVLEHLEDPGRAIPLLSELAAPYLLISVPREPLWRLMNMARAKYWPALGNTPGHLQHWTARGIVGDLSKHMRIVRVLKPIPWTMILCRTRA